MEKRRRIILYGRSVLLGTLEASLQRFPELDVIPLSPPLPDTSGLSALAPDGIIFDLQGDRPEPAFALFEQLPSLTVVGIDPGSDHVILWIGRQLSGITSLDLLRMFTNQNADSHLPV